MAGQPSSHTRRLFYERVNCLNSLLDKPISLNYLAIMRIHDPNGGGGGTVYRQVRQILDPHDAGFRPQTGRRDVQSLPFRLRKF